MYLFIKRVIDLFVAILLIIILSPLLIPIIILLRCTGEGYIFYRQRRIGFRNENFDILKFATMLKNSPNIGTGSITLRNDPRLLPMGKFLRMTKINELPQIINVIKGDMSLVGPRPLVTRTFDAYPENIRYQVYNSRPGITGIGSVVFRDEEALISASSLPPHEFYEKVIAPYKGALEMWYNSHKSLAVDFKIMFLTVWVVVFPQSSLTYKMFRDLPQKVF
ncbi:Sugar transferase involved in LPS biosynthesis (colanic, teichoic acid) [Filimonas lacunae]|uniref:Sugar transferase involved in LPS biosynthesis (Colanic, teichoic acid) n=1 Tax=Filimonas lacunae TaxID=477680 RepID=A0A173MS02_9BACT|nr:sugar transferase [Filimonas lacunae]BAV10209.1 lipid carrier : UDP-N-acetylgalactosaminyltransferase [Filimonas lacunae]SIT18232.1 Sugar transferase involved in LPS biosynthesis (colanic, teichoic acid) [Filimonas lacunae]